MTLYPAASRGHFSFGWLDTKHTFSFGHYMNTERMNFGALRVFNDDVVAPGEGFGTHPHANMEIISIPLQGVIMHQDSMGHAQGLRPGDVQVMSAGSGITHSEYNGSDTDPLAFLQIWIIPNERNVTPRYDQVNVGTLTPNVVHTIVGGTAPLWIHQDANLALARLNAGSSVEQAWSGDGKGRFTFVIEGSVTVNGQALDARDAIGLTESGPTTFTASSDAYLVIIDVPLA
jgi:redox-sensitive bicupin YhaK (pirin superfamily)